MGRIYLANKVIKLRDRILLRIWISKIHRVNKCTMVRDRTNKDSKILIEIKENKANKISLRIKTNKVKTWDNKTSKIRVSKDSKITKGRHKIKAN